MPLLPKRKRKQEGTNLETHSHNKKREALNELSQKSNFATTAQLISDLKNDVNHHNADEDFSRFMSSILAFHASKNNLSKDQWLMAYFAKRPYLHWPNKNVAIKVDVFWKEENHTQDVLYIEIETASAKTDDYAQLLFCIRKKHLIVEHIEFGANWQVNDLKELISLFNALFKANLVSHHDGITFPLAQEPASWLDNVQELKENCSNQSLTFPHVFQYYANSLGDAKHQLWITYPLKNATLARKLENKNTTFSLQVTISALAPAEYKSWLFSQESYYKLHGYTMTSAHFFKVDIHEHLGHKTGQCVATLLAEPGQLFAEIKDCNKGSYLSGTEIIHFIHDLSVGFKIKTLYLCDASRLYDENQLNRNQILFRMTMAVGKDKTWYESLGYEVFSFDKLTPGWIGQSMQNQSNTQNEDAFYLSQNVDEYKQARAALRATSLDHVYDYWSKESDKQDLLNAKEVRALQTKYLPPKTEQTLGSLGKAIYEAKNNKSPDAENDLRRYSNLMRLPDRYFNEYEEYQSHLEIKPFMANVSTLFFTRFLRKKMDLEAVEVNNCNNNNAIIQSRN